MSFSSLLYDTITIYNVESTETESRYGDEQLVWDDGTEYPCRVTRLEQSVMTEDITGQDTRITDYRCWLPAGAVVDALSYAMWRGRQFRVFGEPYRAHGLRNEHHVTITLHELEG